MWVADETSVDAVTGLDLRLHREQAQHAVGAAPDLRRPRFAPGPDRRTHVVHGAHAATLEPALQAEVEIRRIDADEHVRLPVQDLLAQLAAQATQSRPVGEYLGQSHPPQTGRATCRESRCE